jgi:hypothetical protein
MARDLPTASRPWTLFYVLLKLMWFMVLATIWLVVATVIVPVAMIAAATSNRSAARD